MFDNIQRKFGHHLNLNNAVLVLAAVITLSWLWGTINAIQKNFVLQQQVDDLKQQIALYELENQTLEFQKRYYNSAEYLELSARERFNKVAPGEKVINLPPITAAPAPEPQTSQTVGIKNRSNLDQWLYFLFGQKST
jgi:cell division protein FtsB